MELRLVQSRLAFYLASSANALLDFCISTTTAADISQRQEEATALATVRQTGTTLYRFLLSFRLMRISSVRGSLREDLFTPPAGCGIHSGTTACANLSRLVFYDQTSLCDLNSSTSGSVFMTSAVFQNIKSVAQFSRPL